MLLNWQNPTFCKWHDRIFVTNALTPITTPHGKGGEIFIFQGAKRSSCPFNSNNFLVTFGISAGAETPIPSNLRIRASQAQEELNGTSNTVGLVVQQA